MSIEYDSIHSSYNPYIHVVTAWLSVMQYGTVQHDANQPLMHSQICILTHMYRTQLRGKMYGIVNGRRYSVSLYSSNGIGDPDFWAVGGGCEGVFPGILRFDGFDKMKTFPEIHTVKKSRVATANFRSEQRKRRIERNGERNFPNPTTCGSAPPLSTSGI
jgi:hypothetical protein